jgi:hypothetical protein
LARGPHLLLTTTTRCSSVVAHSPLPPLARATKMLVLALPLVLAIGLAVPALIFYL